LLIILLLSVLVTWCQLPGDGSKAETCSSQLAEKYKIVELCVCWYCKDFVKLLNTALRMDGCGNDHKVERRN